MRKYLNVILVVMLMFYSLTPILVHANEESPINKELFYHILIDRFNNGDQSLSEEVDINDDLTYHGGDILGVTKRLDSLKEMGFTTIVLSPVMQNAKRGYHGYWIEDFFEIEPQFGTMDDFNHLIKEAHGRDMKVVLELVTNYAAKSHVFADDPEKADWFIENDVSPIDATEWLDEIIVFNQNHDDVQQYLLDVADFWMDETDIDGFKFHAADHASDSFLQTISEHVKEKNPQFYLIAGTLQGGVFSETKRNIEQIDIFEDVNMYEVMDEVFSEPDVHVTKLFEKWIESSDHKSGLYIDNINTARFSNNFADMGRNSHTAWQLALAFLYTAPGAPIIYQGSEIPMYGPGFPENQYIVDFTAADQDLQKIFEKMGVIRENYDPLAFGDFEEIATDQGMSLFKRTYNNESMYIAINNDSESRDVTINELSGDLQLRGLLHDHTVREGNDGAFRIGIDRESVELFVVQPNVGFNWTFIGFVIGVFILFIGGIIWLSRAQKKRETSK